MGRVTVNRAEIGLRIRKAMLRNANSGLAPDAPAAANAVTRPVAQVGVYLTDEVFLYRVVDLLATRAGEVVELEDCYWLDIVRVPMNDLRARRLRVVTPRRAGASSGACLTEADRGIRVWDVS